MDRDYWYRCPRCGLTFPGDGRPVNICPMCLADARRVE